MVLGLQLNEFAILITAIIGFLLGWLWYGPFLGKKWIKAMEFTKGQLNKAKKKGMGKTMLTGFIMALVSTYVLAIIVRLISAVSVLDGAFAGVLVWLGFYFTSSIGTILWENKSTNLLYINTSYDLVRLLISGAILAVWQ